jgi:hypothetical protein
VRLLDYGIARTVDDSETLRMHATGTPSFMSPEQVQGIEAVGPLTDIYSFGATLFALATGRPPHVAQTAMHLLVKISTERAPHVATLAPELPDPVAALIDRAIAHAPARRWSSAEAMLAEVHRIRAELQIPATALALACRHGATQPDVAFIEATGSVRAMVVSAPRIVERATGRSSAVVLPRRRAPWIAAGAMIAAACAGLLVGRSRHPLPAPATAARIVEQPHPIEHAATSVLEPAKSPAITASASAIASAAVRPPVKKSKPAPSPPELLVVPPDYKDSPY